MALVSQKKSKEIMRHGEVHGKPLTEKQKGFFGLRAGGGTPTRMKRSHQLEAIKKKIKK